MTEVSQPLPRWAWIPPPSSPSSLSFHHQSHPAQFQPITHAPLPPSILSTQCTSRLMTSQSEAPQVPVRLLPHARDHPRTSALESRPASTCPMNNAPQMPRSGNGASTADSRKVTGTSGGDSQAASGSAARPPAPLSGTSDRRGQATHDIRRKLLPNAACPQRASPSTTPRQASCRSSCSDSTSTLQHGDSLPRSGDGRGD